MTPMLTEETFEERVVRERSERRQAYQDLYKGIAPHMTGWRIQVDPNHEEGWTEENRWRFVSDTNGQGISLRIGTSGTDRGKMHVSGYWPQRPNHGAYVSPYDLREESPSINCSLSKSGELIARDILRRFLPEYLRIWNLAIAKIEAENAYQNRKDTGWQRLVATGAILNPRNAERSSEDSRGSIKLAPGYDRGYGDIRMTGEDSVQIELRSLPVDVAILVLNALKAMRS